MFINVAHLHFLNILGVGFEQVVGHLMVIHFFNLLAGFQQVAGQLMFFM